MGKYYNYNLHRFVQFPLTDVFWNFRTRLGISSCILLLASHITCEKCMKTEGALYFLLHTFVLASWKNNINDEASAFTQEIFYNVLLWKCEVCSTKRPMVCLDDDINNQFLPRYTSHMYMYIPYEIKYSIFSWRYFHNLSLLLLIVQFF